MLLDRYAKMVSGNLAGIEYADDFLKLDSDTKDKAVLMIKRGFKKKELPDVIKGSLYYEVLDNVASIMLIKGTSPHIVIILKGGIVVSSVEEYGQNVVYQDLFAYAAKVFHHTHNVSVLTFDYDKVYIKRYSMEDNDNRVRVVMTYKDDVVFERDLESNPIGTLIRLDNLEMTGETTYEKDTLFVDPSGKARLFLQTYEVVSEQE